MNGADATTLNEPSFKDVYGLGSLGFTQGTKPEPDLLPGNQLRIDGVPVPYEVGSFSFQPNEDVSSIDTGFGVVSVAWPELESSGVLSFSLEDVPKAGVPALLSLLTETRRYRWLSFRGRRYRVSGFTPDYAPDEHTRTYSFNISCTAYRPHKSLPPVPGTEVYAVADVRRYGGVRHDDEILHVGGLETEFVIFTTGGLCLWNQFSGHRALLKTDIDAAGSVSYYEGYLYVAYGSAGQTVLRRVRRSGGFLPDNLTLDVPYRPDTHTLQGDTLYFTQSGVLKKLPFTQGRVADVPDAPPGIRVNRLQNPLFLYDKNTNFGNTVSYVPADILGVGMSGEERALVFKADGLYLYRAHLDNKRVELSVPVTNSTGQSTKVASAKDVQRFGLFGNPAMPEGYWLVDKDVTALEPFEPTQESVEQPYYIATGAHLAESATGAVIDGEEAAIDYAHGHVAAVFQTGKIPLDGLGAIYGARLAWGATLPAGSFIILSAQIDDGPLNVVYRSDTDLDGPRFSAALTLPATGGGYTVSLHVQLVGTASQAPVRFGPLGLLVQTGAAQFSDSDGDGYVEAPLTHKHAQLQSVYSDDVVVWGNLRGIYYSGFGYYPYTDKHLYQVFPLI